MTLQTIRNSFFIVLLTSFLAACSGTSTQEGADGAAGAGMGAGDGVGTGTADGSALYSEDLTAGGRLDTVFYFDFDSSVLRPEARTALNQHAQYLRETSINVRLEGHADERGSREYNMALGERRANAVKEYLVLQGVEPRYLEVISYGEERPAALGSDEGSWALNRRVEMTRQ